ncbi:hypothetical protein [Caulobacter segnis]|uniref:ArsR family transcriptional regulator n=1 Tax=Caulobacter segnis TaxID=88688 RepID=A0A2W5UX83_9CAUL|nr:hypothetical protein [Caulobacter segnis]PZR32280.1 MAG: hypothetical protein DI526_17040 [Caulobacter segnis]
MNKTLAERQRESRRLLILELLLQLENRHIDERTLAAALRDMDWETARDVLRSELQWMERQGLVTLKNTEASTWSIWLTERGDLCARGETTEPGVARPALA